MENTKSQKLQDAEDRGVEAVPRANLNAGPDLGNVLSAENGDAPAAEENGNVLLPEDDDQEAVVRKLLKVNDFFTLKEQIFAEADLS